MSKTDQPDTKPQHHAFNVDWSKRTDWTRKTAGWWIFGAFALGVLVGTNGHGAGTSQPATAQAEPQTRVETRTVTQEVTPQSCKGLIATDNAIFTQMSDSLNEYADNMFSPEPWTKLSAFVRDKTPTRQAQVADCEGK